MVAAAVAGAAVVGAAGSAISSSNAAGAAKSAAGEQSAAAQAAAAQQQAAIPGAVNQLWNSQNQAQLQLAPYKAEGQTGIDGLNANYNYLTTPYAPTQAQLAATPGYQFTLAQGLQSTQNAQAAQGLGVSGSALKAAAAYSTGLANSTYQTDATIYQQNQQQIGNLLTGMANNGQNAATAGAQIFANTGQNAANVLTGQTNAAAGTSLTGAQAQAAGTVGAANAVTGGISSATSAASQAAQLNAILAQNTAGASQTNAAFNASSATDSADF